MIRLSTGAAFGVAVAAASGHPTVRRGRSSPHCRTAPGTRPALPPSRPRPTSSTQALGLSKDEKLVVRDVVVDADGTQHVRYDRTYKGLRVLGGDFVVARTRRRYHGAVR